MKQLVLILKNPGTSCNIGCVYCAERRKKYISVDNIISLKQIEKMASLTKDYSLNVLFHGGEPTLLDTDYYDSIMNIFRKYNSDVFFGLQTNATLIDDKWIGFIEKNIERMGISVSLDGTREANKYRLDKTNKETFDCVYNNIKKLEKNNIKTGMICTIVKSTLHKEKKIFELFNSFNNLLFVKLNPCMDRNEDGTLPEWAVSPEEYFKFVCNFFDIQIRESGWDKFFLEPVISVLKNLQGVKSYFCNYSSDKCFNFLSLYPDGRITSCDNYNLENGLLGNVDTIESIESIRYMQNNSKLLNSYNDLLDKCKFCESKNICHGGCIAIRQRYTDNNDYCYWMRYMINHIKRVFDEVKKSN